MSALGSSLCTSAHMSGVWIHMAATSMITQRLASDPEIKLLTFLFFSTFAPPTYLVPTASCAANMHNKEEWNASITNMTVREEDVHDCDPVRQGHVSALLVTSSEFARESLAGQFCSPTALTLGRFATSLSLSLSLSLCLSVFVCVSLLSLCVCRSLFSVCLCLCLLSVFVCLACVCLFLCLCVSVCLCVCLCICVCVCVSLCLCVCLCSGTPGNWTQHLQDHAPFSSTIWDPCESSARATPFCMHPLQRRLCSHMLVPPKWEHTPFTQKECKYRPGGNPPCHRRRPTCWTWSFSQSHGLWSCLWSVLDKPNLLDLVTLTMRKVTSCIINIASPYCDGIQDQRARIPHR